VEILNWLDDHSLYLLGATVHRPVTGPVVVAAFRTVVAGHGVPAGVLTDNGLVYTTRFAGGRRGRTTRNGFEQELAALGVEQKNSSPNHPQTCGKVERFHQTLKKWLTAHPRAGHDANCRPSWTPSGSTTTSAAHRALGRSKTATPAAANAARPKATPPASRRRMSGSAATASTTPASSPCATTASSTTSASDEPTPEPTSSCSSRTSTSG